MAPNRGINRRFVNFAPFALLAGCATGMDSAGARATLPGDRDEQSNLALIARGEAAYASLFEDATVMAFLGERPASRGHFLVMLKRSAARNFLELSPKAVARLVEVAQRVARAEILALGAEGFTLRQNNGSASTIHRFHLHVIPRWSGDKLPDGPQPVVGLDVLEPLAAHIRRYLT